MNTCNFLLDFPLCWNDPIFFVLSFICCMNYRNSEFMLVFMKKSYMSKDNKWLAWWWFSQEPKELKLT